MITPPDTFFKRDNLYGKKGRDHCRLKHAECKKHFDYLKV